MSWWQIVLIALASIVVGLLLGAIFSYLTKHFPGRIKPGSGLIPLNLLAWLLILIIIFFPSNTLRIILGIPLLLFCPGYTLMAALFTKKEGVGGITRVALSFALSIAVVSLIGFVLNYTPWGIRLEPILYSVASFVLITSIIAWLRHMRLAEDERFTVRFPVTMPGWGKSFRDRVLTMTLVIAILGALGTLGYLAATPRPGETFTDFYILGPEGKAENYPRELKVGDEGSVVVGIVNHEGREVSYRVEVVISSKNGTGVGPVVLVDGQKWEGKVSFVPEVAGDNQKVVFLLYEDDEVEPSLEPLHLLVDVKE